MPAQTTATPQKSSPTPSTSSGGSASTAIATATATTSSSAATVATPAKKGEFKHPINLLANSFASISNIDVFIDQIKDEGNAASVADGLAGAITEVVAASSEIDGGTSITTAKSWVGLPVSSVAAIVHAIKTVKMLLKPSEIKAGELAVSTIELAKAAIESTAAIMDIVSKAPSALVAAIPALAIASSAVQLFRNLLQFFSITMSKDLLKPKIKKLLGTSKEKDTKEIIKEFDSIDAKVSNKKYVLVLDQKRIDDGEDEDGKLQERKTRIEDEIEELLKTKKVKGKTRADVAELSFAYELEYINKKRIKRLGISVVANIAKIAGNIAILTGAGAIGGAVVNASAAGAEVGATLVRTAKQKGRDRAARKEAKGKGKSKVYDTSKSSVAKRDRTLEHIQVVMEKVVKLAKDKVVGDVIRANVEMYLGAIGVDPKQLYKTPSAKGQVLLLYKSMRERE